MHKNHISYRWISILLACLTITGCFISRSTDTVQSGNRGPAGNRRPVTAPDVAIIIPGTKICQLVGEYDRERKQYTQNRTYSRYRLRSTDLGSPFRFGNRTYILFGDTQGAVGGDRDAIAYTTDTIPDHGLSLNFIHDSRGNYKPVTIPGIEQGAYDVPMAGLEVNGKMYVYATTGHTATVGMGRSVIARSDDSGHTFHLLYTFSSLHFINVSVIKTEAVRWQLFPGNMKGKVLVFFGTGAYRRSDVYLACQPAKDIENPGAIRYFAGIGQNGNPRWSKNEQMSAPLFDQPEVGELSVTYNNYIDRWILLYNAGNPRGINMRTSQYPWGPWTKAQVIFNPWSDSGYCHFMHTSWQSKHCDSVMDPGRENDWGGEYGPYQYAYFAKGDSTSSKPGTTIYFNMSTWNPYTVVLMKAKLELK